VIESKGVIKGLDDMVSHEDVTNRFSLSRRALAPLVSDHSLEVTSAAA
jgi:hypothetical protein